MKILLKCTYDCSLEVLFKLEQVYISDILQLFINLDVLYKASFYF